MATDGLEACFGLLILIDGSVLFYFAFLCFSHIILGLAMLPFTPFRSFESEYTDLFEIRSLYIWRYEVYEMRWMDLVVLQAAWRMADGVRIDLQVGGRESNGSNQIELLG